ncbi:hypothetical protein Adt_29212 [Abeliophyllum distichum]|uniref:Uncharacterized protein n=1 Tax=Abeliophyllum distichum TaxID=126358 RepID=A0ABD1R8M3_9LAMI
MKIESEEEKLELDDEKINPNRSSSLLESYAAVDADPDTDDKKSDARRRQLLTKLLSQLESLEGESIPQQSRDSADVELAHCSKIGEKSETPNALESCSSDITNEEIIKELKEVKKQNFVTQCLLSALIVLTVVWQLSEVSLILKIKDGFTNPLKSVSGIITGMFNGRPNANVQEVTKHVSTKQREILEPTSLPNLKIPGFPIEHLLGFDSSEDED